jgi:Asp-tRNA(Asn)/Glu-tRNA(Gln) amidotransferase C subunit
MPTDESIRKLCNLSRLEIEDSEFEKTSGKIKETLEFFGKLDEFKMDQEDKSESNDAIEIPKENNIRIEKSFDELRDDVPRVMSSNTVNNPNLISGTSTTSSTTTTSKVTESIQEKNTKNSPLDSFNEFTFLNTKRGYVIGPRIG